MSCKGYQIVTMDDPYFPGETYIEHIDCYCKECAMVKRQKGNEEIEEMMFR